MPLPHPDPNKGNGNDWIETYADAITLLMAFFVLLYSMSSMDEGKFKQLRNALAKNLGHRVVSEGEGTAAQGRQSGGRTQQEDAVAERARDAFASEAQQGEVTVERIPDGVVIEIQGEVLFKGGSATLTTAAKRQLARVAKDIAKSMPGYDVEVEGHTDSAPIKTKRFRSNWDLGAVRASRVADLFVRKGLPTARMMAVSYGSARPKVPEFDLQGELIKENRKANRRIRIKVERGEGALPGSGGAAAGAAGDEGMGLPISRLAATPSEDGYAIVVSPQGIQAEELDSIGVSAGLPIGATGSPPYLLELREVAAGREAHILASSVTPWSVVAPVVFSVGQVGRKVRFGVRREGQAADEDDYSVVSAGITTELPGSGGGAAVAVKFKAKAKGGFAAAAGAYNRALAEVVPKVQECVKDNTRGKVKGKYKLKLRYDTVGRLTELDVDTDPFDGSGPTACIREVLKGLSIGGSPDLKPSTVSLSLSLKSNKPPKWKNKPTGGVQVSVVVAGGGYSVTLPGGNSFGMADLDPAGLAAKLTEALAESEERPRAQVFGRGDVAHGAVIGVLTALSDPEGLGLDVAVGPAAK